MGPEGEENSDVNEPPLDLRALASETIIKIADAYGEVEIGGGEAVEGLIRSKNFPEIKTLSEYEKFLALRMVSDLLYIIYNMSRGSLEREEEYLFDKDLIKDRIATKAGQKLGEKEIVYLVDQVYSMYKKVIEGKVAF